MKIFVYGTLKRKFYNSRLFFDTENFHDLGKTKNITSLLTNAKAVFVTEGTTVRNNFWFSVGGQFNTPYVMEVKQGGNIVKGEIFEVNDSMINLLDILEAVPDHYTRKEVMIRTIDTEKELSCFMYIKTVFEEELLKNKSVNEYFWNQQLKTREVYTPKKSKGSIILPPLKILSQN
eukprot:snap_masked-scaffold_40-processed-gene-0.43-mRNA-1 protein AED:1.00 eAED:1.00 QI:0/0/0/0/1/1/3/0/175